MAARERRDEDTQKQRERGAPAPTGRDGQDEDARIAGRSASEIATTTRCAEASKGGFNDPAHPPAAASVIRARRARGAPGPLPGSCCWRRFGSTLALGVGADASQG
jgi:hypothetical protein